MTWLILTAPLMLLALAVATGPLLVAMLHEHRAHKALREALAADRSATAGADDHDAEELLAA